jgi:hypothetical protein
MPLAGFELTIPVFKREKTFYTLDRAATVAGNSNDYLREKRLNSLVIAPLISSPLILKAAAGLKQQPSTKVRYCHALGDRRRGIGLTIGFIGSRNQLQLSISGLPQAYNSRFTH